MTISATILCGLTIKKTLTVGVDNAVNPTVNVSVGGSTSLRDTGTTPDVETGAGPLIPLVAGAKTIDLTAVPDFGSTINGDGKKPRAVYFENPSSNANSMTFSGGASAAANGNDCLGADWEFTLLPGQAASHKLPDTGINAVSGTNKLIDVAGTLVESFIFGVVFG